MLLGRLDHSFVFALAGIGRGGGEGARITLSLGRIESGEIPVVVEALLGLGYSGLAVAVGYYYVYDNVALILHVVYQEDIVGEVKLIVGIAEQVGFVGGEFFKLVDKIVAQGPEQPARYTEGLACQFECECHGTQDVHLICCLEAGLLIDQLLRALDFSCNRFVAELDGFAKVEAGLVG
jgi:hypothetical protein